MRTNLLCDCTGAINELSFGEAVRRSDLQSSSLLDEEDAAMPQVLHSILDLETDLDNREYRTIFIYSAAILSKHTKRKFALKQSHALRMFRQKMCLRSHVTHHYYLRTTNFKCCKMNVPHWCSRAVSWVTQCAFGWHTGHPHLLWLSCVSGQSSLNGQLAVVHSHLRGQSSQIVWTRHWFGHLKDKHKLSVQAKHILMILFCYTQAGSSFILIILKVFNLHFVKCWAHKPAEVCLHW